MKKFKDPDSASIVILLGLLMVGVGLAFAWPPLGMIWGGLGCLAVGFLTKPDDA